MTHGLVRAGEGTTRRYLISTYDPQCDSCTMLASVEEHDHLHLDGTRCKTPGVSGKPGQMVRCACGAFHH